MSSTRLEQIIDTHRAMAARDGRSVDDLLQRASLVANGRDFDAALREPGLSVIAEIKRRSPSAGDIATELQPASLAKDYEAGGAACLSVLTDETYFGGSVEDLQVARAAVSLPVLRKDFTVDRRDVVDARIMGADALLLIVAALSDGDLATFNKLAGDLQLAVIFEVHSEAEVERAITAGASIIGVNQRDLHTFEIHRSLAERLSGVIPRGVLKIAESGVRDADDVGSLRDAGYDAVLVGTSLVSSDDARRDLSAIVDAGLRA